MLNRWKHSIWILLALVAGALFAGAFTHITYPCPLGPGEAGCVSFEKAVMHLTDLAANMQGSLNRFLLNWLVGFVIVLAFLIVLNKFRGKKHLGSKN